MRAIVCGGARDAEFLSLRDVPVPRPGAREVVVRVHATGLNALDWRPFTARLQTGRVSFGARLLDGVLGTHGKVPGADVSGVVDAVGEGVTRFHVGDAVFGVTAGLKGGLADYARAREDHLVARPPGVSFEAAAALPTAALTALQAVRDGGQLRAGQRVLVHGASGGVGSFAVQLARAFGAEVTAVTSARNAERALAAGAARVLDYARDDFSRAPERYALIVAVNGRRSLLDYRRALAPGGRCVVVGGPLSQIAAAALLGPLLSLVGDRKVGFLGVVGPRREALAELAELLAAGRLEPPIDRRYPLPAAPDALRYLAQGHAAGKVVVQVAEDAAAASA